MEDRDRSFLDKIEQIRLLKQICRRFPSFRGESVLDLYRRMQKTRMPELEKNLLECGPYNPAWRSFFEREARLLKSLLPPEACCQLHHIGSTAIPGMASNSVIDMALVVECDNYWDSCLHALRQAGFRHFGNSPMGPDAEWYWNTRHAEVVYVAHLDRGENGWLEDNLGFCRYLASHPQERDRYMGFKEQNHDLKRQNIILYSLRKLQFVIEISERSKP